MVSADRRRDDRKGRRGRKERITIDGILKKREKRKWRK